MDWFGELQEKERLVRKDFENLSAIGRRRDLVSYDARRMALRRIRSRMSEIRTILALHLGKDAAGQAEQEYQVDLKLPLYSHLSRILTELR
jgi:hypothetical protein